MASMPQGPPTSENRSARIRADEPRVDLRQKVTGTATYVEDLSELPGTAYAAALRSPYSHARIVSIDSSRAEQLPGVIAVLHREKLGQFQVHPEHPDVDNSFVATDKARFDGDLIGMVVAEDLRTAQRAVELIDVEYQPLPTLFSLKEALAPGAPLIHEHLDDNLALQLSLEWGNVESALREADHIIEGAFTSPTIYHHPIEPAMSAVVKATEQTIEFWAPTNNPFDVVDGASEVLGVDREQVRVHVPYVGGNFGAKHMSPEVVAAAALSRKIGRPVKYVASEEESFRATARHAMTYRARAGVRADGTLVALDVELDVDTGAYFTGARIATGNAVNSSWGGYRVPNFRVRARTAYTNKVPAAMFRNTGKNQTAFGLDCLMDEAACQLGMEPVTFRLKNLMRRGETLPATRWKRDGREGPAQSPPLDTDFADLIDQALEGIGWDGRSQRSSSGGGFPGVGQESWPPAPSPQPPAPRIARGRGLAVSLRRGASIGSATAMATLEADGAVSISHNAPDVGEGAHTMISVVAATSLGVPRSQVRVGEPDTGNQLPFSGTSSQRTTVQMGSAVRNACEALKAELARGAAEVRGGTPEEWTLAQGSLRRGQESLSLAELARRLPPGWVLRAVGAYERGPVEDISFGSHDHWSPGVAAAEVEVDRETGEIRVVRYAAVADAGTVLHYSSAKGQIEGGAVMGFGASLFEELCYQEGQLLNADPFQYRLPLMGDIPEAFQVSLLENGDGPGPFGSKGIAQTSIPCAAPAIANAVADAIGARLTSIPFSPEKVLRALGSLKESDS